jgi:formylmethanofuran dehydrogenase subunit C
LILKLKKKLSAPVSAECISPDTFAGKQESEIAGLTLWEGNRKRQLSEIFEVEGISGSSPSETTIHIKGDLSKTRRIGAGMTEGRIVIQGNGGMHIGEEMKGGTILVEGNAGSWLGSAMKGGVIEVKKNAGDYIGGAHRGSTKGMRGGVIIVHGNAGTEAGSHMRKGLIKIFGDADQFAGIYMKDGAIVVHGNSRGRLGAFMTSGKIVVCGKAESVLPTFSIDKINRKTKIHGDEIAGPFYVFVGDLAEHGNGKLYLSQTENEHLKSVELFL